MTRLEAIAKLNNAGISVVANAKDDMIFVGIRPTKVYGTISYQSTLYLKENNGWGFDPSLIGGPKQVIWFAALENAVDALIMLVKILNT